MIGISAMGGRGGLDAVVNAGSGRRDLLRKIEVAGVGWSVGVGYISAE